MGFNESINICFKKKYATFEGRASRSEFWWWFLFSTIVVLASLLISEEIDNPILYLIIWLILVIPGFSVIVRRLHDVNRSGWNYFWILIPILGSLLLLYWFTKKGDAGKNNYDVSER